MKTRKIKTELGYICGRDAIYLDIVKHIIDENKLILKGDISGDLCTLSQSKDWIKYELVFDHVLSFKCISLDDFNENLAQSSFDIVINNDLSSLNEYILSTYDHVYEIKAREYQLIIDES